MQLEGSTFIVTGGASGLGHAVASHIVSLGGRVTLLDLPRGDVLPARARLERRRRLRGAVGGKSDGIEGYRKQHPDGESVARIVEPIDHSPHHKHFQGGGGS